MEHRFHLRLQPIVTTVCAIRSVTVGTPEIRTPAPPPWVSPPPLPAAGNTARRHPIPDLVQVVLLILFELGERLPIDSSSPLFAFTFRHASQPSLWISQTTSLPTLLRSSDSSRDFPVDHQTKPDNPSPSLHPHYRGFTTTTRRSALPPATVSPSRLSPLGTPSHRPPNQPTASGRGVLLFRTGAWTGLAPPICRTPPEQ